MTTTLLAMLVLITRLDLPRALAHPTRAAFVMQAQASPGATIAELARVRGVDPKTASYHLRALARLGCLVLVDDGRRVRVFPPGQARELPPPPRAVLALQALAEGADGPASLARVLGIPRGTAGSLLEALSERGLAVREGASWRLSDAAREGLAAGSGAQAAT